MEHSLKNAISNRRSFYGINNESPISDKEIKEIIDLAVLHVPSAFNSQSARIVLLQGDHHQKLWQITKDILKVDKTDEQFSKTEEKIDSCFASGYGTILFYEDWRVVENLQKNFPSYKDKFPEWAQHTSAMHQFAIWTMLEDAGLGASLQHYNPLIDQAVADEWNISLHWKLIAQMPFGKPIAQPGEKEFQPLEERIKVFK